MFFAVGLAVFLVRLHHPGAYAFPAEGNLRAAVLAIALGIWFSRPQSGASKLRRGVDLVLVVAAPVVLFFALYATLAELEEVVVLKAVDDEGRAASLRLWVMDADGAEWVNMGRAKALENGLVDQRVEWLRSGAWSCRHATLVEDRAVVDRNHRLGSQKYAVKRLAQAVGVFGEEVAADIVSVRLTPCERGLAD